VLAKLRLINFRAFQDFTISFGDGAYLVGPNNAGKSTILTALRTADALLRYAYARKPDRTAFHNGSNWPAYPVNLREFPSLKDSLRHEFGSAEARLELTWKDGAKLTAVWPEEIEDDADPFFFLERKPGFGVTTVKHAREFFPPLGVVPILNPIEHTETLLEVKYVRQHVAGRLSSRHFRNQLRMLGGDGALEGFLAWSEEWLGEVSIESLGQHIGDSGMELDVYYLEVGSRVPKELVWAGDGIQIWFQILYHVYRVRACQTIILDEPDVYLHPDLQRRLVQLLESTGRQVVLATHSTEVIAEADPRIISLVDKKRKQARRARSEADLELLSDMLGTAFNIRLARALRSRVAVFVEGQDMTLIRRFAKTLGCTSLEREQNITVIPLGGYSKWGQVESFSWLCEEMLPKAIEICVILDRDYRTEKTVQDVLESFKQRGIFAHVWSRKELESYVLTPSVIARFSGATVDDVEKWIDSITEGMADDVFSRLLDERIRAESSGTNHAVNVTSKFKKEFDKSWKDASFRRNVCPPKKILSALNQTLQTAGVRTVSSASLARAHRLADIGPEMTALLREIEAMISTSRSS